MSTQKVSELTALTTAADDDLLLISDVSETESKKITVANLIGAPVDAAVAALVDSAPATLDTLNELAAALGDDANFSTTVTTSIGTKWTQDNDKISNWDTAYSWGNHASAGYLTGITGQSIENLSDVASMTPTDGQLLTWNNTGSYWEAADAPVSLPDQTGQSGKYLTTNGTTASWGTVDTSNGDTAYSWGDHSLVGYVTASSTATFTNKSGNISQWTNDSGYLTSETYTGTVTSVAATAGTGISISGSPITSSGTLTITNTAPDQTVSLTQGGATTISGTYPNFTISSTDTNTTYSAGSGLDLTGTTFSVEPDLRDGITHVGLDAGDYISWSNNAYTSFYVNGAEDWRMVAGGAFHADGDVIAYSATISDERLKTDIKTIDNALDMVNNMRGVTFTYKKDGKQSAGVVAQELEKIFPRAISETQLPLKADDDKEYKVVQYDQLHGVLIEAIKELTARVKELESK